MEVLAKFLVKIPKVRALGKMEGQMVRINQAKRNGSTSILRARVLIRSWFKIYFICLSLRTQYAWVTISHGIKLKAARGYIGCSVCLQCFHLLGSSKVWTGWLICSLVCDAVKGIQNMSLSVSHIFCPMRLKFSDSLVASSTYIFLIL